MKKYSFMLIALSLSIAILNGQNQINRFTNPTTINAGLEGWNLEWDEGSFTLQAEDDAIKVANSNATEAMKGKFQQRFTTSVNGKYTLKFKAKKDAATAQKIEINLLALDSWAAISSSKSVVTVNSNEYAEYSATFEYSTDERAIMPHGAQVEIYVNGVTGNLWFKDFMLTENSNNLITYQDDFEKNISTGTANGETNNWKGQRLQLSKNGENTTLQYTQTETMGNNPWDISFARYIWSMNGIRYRIQFDMSASVNIPRDNGVGFEMLSAGGADKICNQYFELTEEMQTFNVITKATALCINYEPTFYVGRIPANEKLYVDNFMIAPIHLYNATVSNVDYTTADINWLHSGYLAGDKLDIVLLDGEKELPIATDIEIVDGKTTIHFPQDLATGEYRLKLVDVVGEGDFAVNNETTSESFLYTSPAPSTGIDMSTSKDKVEIYVAHEEIHVTGCPENSIVRVFSSEGKMIEKRSGGSTNETFQLEKGVYILQVNDRNFKIAL